MQAEVVARAQETPDMFTLRLRLTDHGERGAFDFEPGQFNMVHLPGVGAVPLSIASDPARSETLDHTIRAVGRITRALSQLTPGDRVGLRGPFGRGWPMRQAEGGDLVVLTGGLGCAPVVAAISYAVERRHRFRRLVILQGVKHSADMIWRERYRDWARLPNTQVRLAADAATKGWMGHVGLVTDLLEEVSFDPEQAVAMVCGPQPMMLAGSDRLVQMGVAAERIWLSLERSFSCGGGYCGHCQIGPYFVCRDGPVFPYAQIGWLLGTKGF
jgi:sulfhydrogenase subunit gamma (sulfur reductase)